MREVGGVDHARQFLPFSALNGLEQTIREWTRYREARIDLAADALEELDRTLRSLCPGELLRIRSYRDGAYREQYGHFRRTDPEKRLLLLEEGSIALEDILAIEKEN